MLRDGAAARLLPAADCGIRRWRLQFRACPSERPRFGGSPGAGLLDAGDGRLQADLALALQRGFSAPGVAVGTVPLATGAVGIAISPDGTLIYVTTFGQYGPYGRLWVINAARAERTAGPGAVVASTAAGCQPVRVALSDDGRVAWVSALQSNAVLAFDTATLRQHPSAAPRRHWRGGRP